MLVKSTPNSEKEKKQIETNQDGDCDNLVFLRLTIRTQWGKGCKKVHLTECS